MTWEVFYVYGRDFERSHREIRRFSAIPALPDLSRPILSDPVLYCPNAALMLSRLYAGFCLSAAVPCTALIAALRPHSFLC